MIGSIHLYSLIFETHFTYAGRDDISITTLICGIPFGLAIWAFANIRRKI